MKLGRLLVRSLFGVLIAVPFISYADVLYTVSPVVMNEEVEARDIIEKEIIITNTGDAPATIYPRVNHISLEEGGTVERYEPSPQMDRSTSLPSWLEISRQGINLKPGESRTIPLTIRVNPEPVPGTYNAFIGFGWGRNRDEADQQILDGKVPGVVVTVTVLEKKKEALKLSRFIVDRFVTRNENEAASFTFTNSGDKPVTPQGEIIFFSSTGEEVGSVKLNTENILIAPGEDHTFNNTVPLKGLFGKYKAFLSIEYGSDQRATIHDTSYFYALPTVYVIGSLGLIILLMTLAAWYMHAKYFKNVDDLESNYVSLHVKDDYSEAKEHDINLRKTHD